MGPIQSNQSSTPQAMDTGQDPSQPNTIFGILSENIDYLLNQMGKFAFGAPQPQHIELSTEANTVSQSMEVEGEIFPQDNATFEGKEGDHEELPDISQFPRLQAQSFQGSVMDPKALEALNKDPFKL